MNGSSRSSGKPDRWQARARRSLNVTADTSERSSSATNRRQRLKSRKARYDEGRITAEPYLDAVSQNAEAVVAEAECVCGYNASIAAFGEAKGTLLGDRFILVIDQPLRIPKNWVDGPDEPVERPTAGARPRYKIAGEQNDMPELDLTPKR